MRSTGTRAQVCIMECDSPGAAGGGGILHSVLMARISAVVDSAKPESRGRWFRSGSGSRLCTAGSVRGGTCGSFA